MVVSTGSAPPRCAAPSMWAGQQRMYGFGWSGTPPLMCLRHFSTWSATWPGVTAAFGLARPGCYVRVADEAQAAALLAHPAASDLGLRSVAPGVLVAAVDEHELVPLLRELGHNPAIENAAGEVIVTQPSRRATPQSAKPAKAVASAAEVAAALLARERRHRVNGQPATTATTEGTVEQLRSATRTACRYEWSTSMPTAAGPSASWRLWISLPAPYAPSTAPARRS